MTSCNEQLLYKKNRNNSKFKDYTKEDLENRIENFQKDLARLHVLNAPESIKQNTQNMLGEIVKEYKLRYDKGEFQYTGEISKNG